MTMKVF